jgi:hypothetical protein
MNAPGRALLPRIARKLLDRVTRKCSTECREPQRLEGEAGGASEDTPPAASAHLLGDLHERS